MSKEYMTTFEMLAVSPITLTIRQSEVQKELVGGTISKKNCTFGNKLSDSLYDKGSDSYFTVLYCIQFLAYEVCVATESILTLSISGHQK